MKATPEIFIVVGEPSGDLHASLLVEELQARREVSISAVGGPRLKAVGADIVVDAGDWGAIGVADVLRRVPAYYAAMRKVVRRLVARPPDLLLLVDFSAFNMRLLRRLGPQRRPRCLYFFPPASWRRKDGDWSSLARLTDCVATPFAWSEQILRKHGVNAHFVGHPVIDRVRPAEDVAELRRELGVPEDALCVGLLPGSRRVERRLLGPVMLQAAELLADRYRSLHVLFSPPPTTAGGRDERLNLQRLEGRLTAVEDSTKIMQAADFIITAFGTATLEAAVALCPMISLYRGTPAMWLQWHLARPDTPYYAMPNIIANDLIVPELIQPRDTDAAGLVRAAVPLIEDEAARRGMVEALGTVRDALGRPGALKRTAELVLATMQPCASGQVGAPDDGQCSNSN